MIGIKTEMKRQYRIAFQILALFAFTFTFVEAQAKKTLTMAVEARYRQAFDKLVSGFGETKPGIVIKVVSSTSDQMVSDLSGNKIDVAIVDNGKSESAAVFGPISIAFEPWVFIVHPRRIGGMKKIVRRQVEGIFFKGNLRDFHRINPQLIGSINVYAQKEDQSGARLLATHIAGDSAARVFDSARSMVTEKIVSSVATDENGLGFVPKATVDGKSEVHTLDYGDDWAYIVPPSEENIVNGKYKLTMVLSFMRKDSSDSDIGTFLSYLRSAAGSQILKASGLVPGG